MSFILNIPTTKGPRFGPDKDSECRPFDMPFSPFNPLDKLGRVADWISEEETGGHHHHHHHQRNNASNAQRGGYHQQQPHRQPYNNNNRSGNRTFTSRNDRYNDTNESSFGFKQEYDESSFATVDASGRTAAVVVATPSLVSTRGSSFSGTNQRGGGRGSSRGSDPSTRGTTSSFRGSSQSGMRPSGSASRGGNRGGNRGGYNNRGGHHFQQRVVRESSLVVDDTWTMVGELDLPRVQKHGAMEQVPSPVTLKTVGSVAMYAKQYDRLSTKNEMSLQASSPRSSIKFSAPSTLEDPILLSMIEDRKESCKVPTIFTTDAILSQVMNAPRAIYSFDLVLTRVGENMIVLDKRPGTMDLESVNENANEAPQDHPTEKDFVNNPNNLALESTLINANYSQQVLDHTNLTQLGSDPVPFHNDRSPDEIPSAAFVYKEYKFEEYMDIVVRTEVDAVTEVQGKPVTLTVRALNQAPGLPGQKLDWRKSLDTQRGAVMAVEMRNNGYKLLRWITQAILAETELMKLGFVGRCTPRDATRHTILGLTTYKPSEFATQMNMSMAHGFGILYALSELVCAQGPGKYVLIKDPNKPVLSLYAVTMNPLSRAFVVGARDPFEQCVVFSEGKRAE